MVQVRSSIRRFGCAWPSCRRIRPGRTGWGCCGLGIPFIARIAAPIASPRRLGRDRHSDILLPAGVRHGAGQRRFSTDSNNHYEACLMRIGPPVLLAPTRASDRLSTAVAIARKNRAEVARAVAAARRFVELGDRVVHCCPVDCERTARKWPSYKGFRSIFGGVDLNAITPAGAILSADEADRHWCAIRHAVWVYTLEGVLSGTAFEKLRMGTGVLKLSCRYGEAI